MNFDNELIHTNEIYFDESLGRFHVIIYVIVK